MNLYDSGARFQANTGAFLSADPMAEKYYGISPYAYCAGNPVNLVDPEGIDIVEIDKDGNVVHHLESSLLDVVYIVEPDDDGNYRRVLDENGNDVGIYFPHGTLEWGNYDFNGDNPLHVRNAFYGNELFKFLSDNSNVEYGIVNTMSDGAYLMSNNNTHAVNMTYLAYNLNQKGYFIVSILHNHPNNTIPSGYNKEDKYGDKRAVETWDKLCGYDVIHAVYLKQYNSIIRFTASSIDYRNISPWRNFNPYPFFNLPIINSPLRSLKSL